MSKRGGHTQLGLQCGRLKGGRLFKGGRLSKYGVSLQVWGGLSKYGGSLQIWRHLGDTLVVEAVPLLRGERPDEGVVVPSVGSAAVHEHRLEPVLIPHRRVRLLREVAPPLAVHVERRRELEALVHLGHRVGVDVVLEAPQVQLEDRRQLLEVHALLGVLLAVLLALVLVLAVEELLLDVLVERGVQVLAPLDWHLQVVELLVPRADKVNVDALDVRGVRAAEEVRHRTLDRGALHLLLELIDEHPIELLRVGAWSGW